MILRLVYSFFFLSLVTGNQRLEASKKTTAPCETKQCECRDKPELVPVPDFPPSPILIQDLPTLVPTLRADDENYYGYTQKRTQYNTVPRLETKSYDVELVPEQEKAHIQVVEEERTREKTICFTPQMVQKMVKVALEYVSQMPSDLNNMIDSLDQDMNRNAEQDSIEEHYTISKPVKSVDTRTILQLVNKPSAETKTNIVLKYDLPSSQDQPQCREALEKLIEIAYKAYLEIEQIPQCRDYLYSYASEQEESSKGRLDYGLDLKSLIASILEQIDRKRSQDYQPEYYKRPEYDISEITIPQVHEFNVPQVQEIKIPEIHHQIHEFTIPQTQEIHEFTIPQTQEVHEFTIPQTQEIRQTQEIHEFTIPQTQEVHEFTIPQTQEVHEFTIPQTQEIIHEYTIPQTQEIHHEYNIPQTQEIHEYRIPQTQEIHEYNIPIKPEVREYNIPLIPEVHEYNIPQTQEIHHEYNIPQTQEIHHEYNIPQTQEIHEYNIPQTQEIREYNIPQTQEIREYNIPQTQEIIEYNIPQTQEIREYNIPQTQEIREYNIPQTQEIREYNIPQTQEIREYNIPQTHEIREYPIPQPHEYVKPQPYENREYIKPQTYENRESSLPQTQEIHEYTIPQVHEFYIPQVEEINKPQVHQIPDFYPKKIPLQSEETVDVLLDLLDTNDQNNELFDRVMDIVEENYQIFQPQILQILIPLLNAQKQKNIPSIKDILLILLETQRNKQLPWNNELTEMILSHLVPDQNGEVDSRVVKIILTFFKKPTSQQHIEYVLSLLQPFEEGEMDTKTSDILIKLINSNLNHLLLPEHIDVLLNLLLLTERPNGGNTKEDEIIEDLSRWNEMGLTPKQLNIIISLLKPDVNGIIDQNTVDVIYFLITQHTQLGPKQFNFLISFLLPENGVVDSRRIDLIYFILSNTSLHPEVSHILLSTLMEYGPKVMKSTFIDILLFMNNNGLLTPQLLESLVGLLINELNGSLDDNQVKVFFIQLGPLKNTNPKLVVDILSHLNEGGLATNLVEWLQNAHNSVPSRDSAPVNLQVLLDNVDDLTSNDYLTENDFRVNDEGYQTNEDFVTIFKWLESQGLLSANPSDEEADLVEKLLKILELGKRELGVVELTYMLKHEKPLVYQPVYYVKYRLPIISFISNLKSMIVENPQLSTDPIKLLQEMIVVSNVTEVSPNLQGYPKDEILKLTVNDGDLVQAKILDEQNLNLNEQITYVHTLNSDISPEELLQLNRVNEATYYPNLVQVKGSPLENMPISEVDGILGIPTVHYEEIRTKIGPPQIRHQVQIQSSTLPQFRFLHPRLRRNAQYRPQD